MDSRGIGWLGAILIFIVGSIALTLAINPQFREDIADLFRGLGSSALSPSEVREHASKYLGKEIIVEGYFSGVTIPTFTENYELENTTLGVIAEKIPAESLNQILAVEILGDLDVISGEKYRFTGVLEKTEFAQYDPSGYLSIILKASKVEPA